MKREGFIHNIKANKLSYLLITPYFVLFLIFTVIPVVSSIGLSFTYYNVLQAPKWVGLANYAKMFFADEIFLKALINTLVMAVM